MNKGDISAQINALSRDAEERMRTASPTLSSTCGGAVIDFMTDDEKKHLHRLKLQLPSFQEERSLAKERIAQRLALRRQGKK